MKYLAFGIFYGLFVLSWNGFSFPHFDYESIHSEIGVAKCEGGPSNKANGGTYVVNDKKYVGGFSRLFGFTSTSCSSDLIGNIVEIRWIESTDPSSRVLVQISDVKTQKIYGIPADERLALYKHDENDYAEVWIVKIFVGVIFFLIMRKFQSSRKNKKTLLSAAN